MTITMVEVLRKTSEEDAKRYEYLTLLRKDRLYALSVETDNQEWLRIKENLDNIDKERAQLLIDHLKKWREE